MHTPHALDWRDTSLFQNIPSASSITHSRDLNGVADIQRVAFQSPHYVELANLSAQFMKDNFSCTTRAKSSLFQLGRSTNSTEATVSLRDFLVYLFYTLKIGTADGIDENVVYGALFLLQKIKRISPKLKCTYGHRLFLASTIVSQSYMLSYPLKTKYFVEYAQYLYTDRQVERYKAEMKGFLLNKDPFDRADPIAVTDNFRSKLYHEYGDYASFVLSKYSEARKGASSRSYGYQTSQSQYEKPRKTKKTPMFQESEDDSSEDYQTGYRTSHSRTAQYGNSSMTKKKHHIPQGPQVDSYEYYPMQQQQYAQSHAKPPKKAKKNIQFDDSSDEYQMFQQYAPPANAQSHAKPPKKVKKNLQFDDSSDEYQMSQQYAPPGRMPPAMMNHSGLQQQPGLEYGHYNMSMNNQHPGFNGFADASLPIGNPMYGNMGQGNSSDSQHSGNSGETHRPQPKSSKKHAGHGGPSSAMPMFNQSAPYSNSGPNQYEEDGQYDEGIANHTLPKHLRTNHNNNARHPARYAPTSDGSDPASPVEFAPPGGPPPGGYNMQ